MKVKIRTKDIHFSMPVPVSMAGFIVKLLPDRMFQEMREQTPEPIIWKPFPVAVIFPLW